MSEANKSLPPVPPPVIAAARSNVALPGRTTSAPTAASKTIFDGTRPEIQKARQQADSTRRSLQATLQSLRHADKAAADALSAIEASADTAAIFAHEGLTPVVLKQARDLIAPILKTFTAA